MGKRYYCDYCDRSFIDDVEARKKHLQGMSHLRAKKLHYKAYRDLKTIVEEEIVKEECRRFRQIGECQFGDNCNYTHYSKEQLYEMKQQVDEENFQKNCYPHIASASVEEWLEKFRNPSLPSYCSALPECAMMSPDLPASLQPVTEQRLSSVEFNDWG